MFPPCHLIWIAHCQEMATKSGNSPQARGDRNRKFHGIGADLARVFSYVVEHDLGFAPNPYGTFCTLAYCKPEIRRTAAVGDYVIGTGATSEALQNSMIYWMRIDEIIHFDEYWRDARFARKKPKLNGSRILRFGDNIYHLNHNGDVIQEDSFHSEHEGRTSLPNLKRDVGKTAKILIGKDFSYFGREALRVPHGLRYFIKKGPGHKCKFSGQQVDEIVTWLEQVGVQGFVGIPSKWKALTNEEKRSV